MDHYSLTGNTKKTANALAEEPSAEVNDIITIKECPTLRSI